MSKLKLGKNSTTTAFFDSCVVIHANFEPYVISLLADPNANVGLISALIPDIKEFLEPIRSSATMRSSDLSGSMNYGS